MIVIRPIRSKDQHLFTDFSLDTLVGMTNLPHEKDKFIKKIAHSEKSFDSPIHSPGEEEYYFVLEDLTTGHLGGICGILAQSRQSFGYVYQIESLKGGSTHIPSQENKVLKVVSNPPDSSEVCALYLHKTFRHTGQGKLLSFSRFLFIAAFKERFRKNIVAEMRGYIDEQNGSPFWDAIGHHFCTLSFDEVMSRLDQLHDDIREILPEYPIYISLLPKEAQEVIGKTHNGTKPAYEMLLQQNFAFNQQVDIIEGGPLLKAKTVEIETIKKSSLVEVELTSDLLENQKELLLGNERIDFRACLGKIELIGNHRARINNQVAEALLLKNGDRLRYASIH